MEKARILVVEDDDSIIDIMKDILTSLGYKIPAVAVSGEEAIEKAEKFRPDLILMDIQLKGHIDGVKAAEQIRARFNIPVVYVTAYSSDTILQRAKTTEPYGYIVKPFQARELHSAIEICLYKARVERRLNEQAKTNEAIIHNIGDGLIVLDQDGVIKTFNLAAEELFRVSATKVLGKPFRLVLPSKELETLILERARETLNFVAELHCQRKDGSLFPAHIHVSTIQETPKNPSTYIIIIRDLSVTKEAEQLRTTLARTTEYLNEIRRLLDAKLAEEIGLVVTYSSAQGPSTMFHDSRLSDKEFFNASYRGFTLLISGVDYREAHQIKYAGSIEIPESDYFTLGFYRAVQGSPADIQADSRLKTTVVMIQLVLRKKIMAFLLKKLLEIEEFLVDATIQWTQLTDLTEVELKILHEKIREFILKTTENQREELIAELVRQFSDQADDVPAPELIGIQLESPEFPDKRNPEAKVGIPLLEREEDIAKTPSKVIR